MSVCLYVLFVKPSLVQHILHRFFFILFQNLYVMPEYIHELVLFLKSNAINQKIVLFLSCNVHFLNLALGLRKQPEGWGSIYKLPVNIKNFEVKTNNRPEQNGGCTAFERKAIYILFLFNATQIQLCGQFQQSLFISLRLDFIFSLM